MWCFSVIWLNLLVHILFALLPMKSYFSYYIKICDTVQQMGTKKDIHSTSTRKAFRSLSLSMVLIATSFPFHTALKTTPKVPLPTA